MNKTMSIFLFAFSLTLCLNLQPHHLAAASRRSLNTDALVTSAVKPRLGGDQVINKVCDQSPHKLFCLHVLNSNPDSKRSDLRQLTYIAIQAASIDAAATSDFIHQSLLSNNVTDIDPAGQQALSDCGSNYEDVVEEIDDAVNALLSDDIKNQQVVTWLGAALAAVDTCDASVKVQSGVSAMVAQKNHLVRQLCTNALHVFKVFIQHSK